MDATKTQNPVQSARCDVKQRGNGARSQGCTELFYGSTDGGGVVPSRSYNEDYNKDYGE